MVRVKREAESRHGGNKYCKQRKANCRANHQLFGMTKPSLKSGTNVLGVALNVDQRQVARESLVAVENREEAE